MQKFALPAAAALAASAIAVAVSAAPPANTAARGKMLFMRCVACHAVAANGPRKIGPHLQGISGRAAAAVAGFNYSPAMRASKVRWDDATLDRWLTKPSAVVPGTSMAFAGMPNPADRQALIAYLKKPVP